MRSPGPRWGRAVSFFAATLASVGACTYDFDRFASHGGIDGGGGASGNGGGATGSSAGSFAETGGAAGDGTAGAGGASGGGAGSSGAASGGADAGGDGARAGGGAGSAGAAGVGGTSGAGGRGGSAVSDASDAKIVDAPLDIGPADASDAGFDCAAVSGIVYQGHCYFGRTGPFNWDTAATSCPFGAHLATITSATEQAVAQQVLPNQDRWIGMRKPATAPKMEQFFYWVTGETFTTGTSYTNWDIYTDADREPNFTGDCVRMEFNSKWADDGCTKAYTALCERE